MEPSDTISILALLVSLCSFGLSIYLYIRRRADQFAQLQVADEFEVVREYLERIQRIRILIHQAGHEETEPETCASSITQAREEAKGLADRVSRAPLTIAAFNLVAGRYAQSVLRLLKKEPVDAKSMWYFHLETMEDLKFNAAMVHMQNMKSGKQ